jgi:hypothetical protein
MADLVFVLWQLLAGAGLVAALLLATALPPVQKRFTYPDRPIVWVILVLTVFAAVSAGLGLLAERFLVYAPLSFTAAGLLMLFAVLLLSVLHRKATEKAGPALTAMLLPVLASAAGLGVLGVVRFGLWAWRGFA